MTTGSLPTAAALDAADPLAGYRDRFVTDGDVVAYLDGNSLGRPLRSTPGALADFAREAWGGRLIRGWDEAWMSEPTTVGDRLGAVVLGAAAGQVLVGDSTSVLIYKLLRAAVDASPGRTEVIIDRHNFPTDRYLVEGVAAERGLTVRWLDVDLAGGVTPETLEPVLSPRTAVVVLSHVAYRSAWLADAPAITAAVHGVGAMIIWDLSHAVGSVPVELDAWGADLAVGCTYKYLNGGPGSPAFAYVRRDLQERLQPPMWGWMGAADPFDMTAPYAPSPGLRRFLTGTPPILGMQPLQQMVDLIAEVGMPAIRAKSMIMTDWALELIDRDLAHYEVMINSPREPARRGSHITIDHPAFRSITPDLWSRGIVPDFRPPSGIRLGFSPLSTSFAEVEVGVRTIADALRAAV